MTRILSERAAVVVGSGLIAGSLSLVVVASNVSWLCVGITLLGVATSIMKTTMTGLFTKAAPPEMLGGVLGIVVSCNMLYYIRIGCLLLQGGVQSA